MSLKVSKTGDKTEFLNLRENLTFTDNVGFLFVFLDFLYP